MGISNAINNAVSGLRATSRGADLVSQNVANAATPGYSAKALDLAQRVAGTESFGVSVAGVLRAGDPFLTAARRRDEAGAEGASAEADGMRRVADLALAPATGDSLQSRFLELENSLRAFADTPESASLQQQVADAAGGAAAKLNALSTETTRMRVDADADIQRQVDALNEALRRIEQLNREIQETRAVGRDPSALEDERDRQIEVVNGIVPIKTVQEQNGGMLLTTQGGATLMMGSPQPLSFAASHAAGIDASSTLGGVTHLGRTALDMSALGLQGGTLDAAFKTRDVTAVGFGAELDAVARDLVERFQTASIPAGGVTDAFMSGYDYSERYDAAGGTYATAAAVGLFTDEGGVPFDSASVALPETGLAGRISLNAAIDPTQGGDASLLQTGLFEGAPEPTATASTFPTALYDAFTAQRTLVDAPGSPGAALGVFGARSAVDMVSEWSSLRESAAGRVEAEAAFQRGAVEALRDEELAIKSVNTDEELSNLLRIEQAYAANARVLETVEQMINRILQI